MRFGGIPLLALALALGMAVPMARAAGPLTADLSSHYIAITTGFIGTSVILFGATDGPGDIVVLVRGPENQAIVRRKERVLDVWINTQQTVFENVPSYYAMFSTRALGEILSDSVQATHQIGLRNLHPTISRPKIISPVKEADFRAALRRQQEVGGLYSENVGKVFFLGERLFRATIPFPVNVPIGTYLVEVFLVRDQTIVSAQTTPLLVSESGVNAEVHEFAETRALLYGIIAVAAAALAGWLASLPFRNR